jgi:hypothetical protein
MSKFLLAFTFLAVIAGCKKEEAAAAGPPSELVTKLEALADQGCGCKDADCATGVKADVKALAGTTTAGAIPDADLPKLQAAQAKLDGCMAKLDPRLADYHAITEELCACKDKKCAEKANAKFQTWADAVRVSPDPIPGGLASIKDDGAHAASCLLKFGIKAAQ